MYNVKKIEDEIRILSKLLFVLFLEKKFIYKYSFLSSSISFTSIGHKTFDSSSSFYFSFSFFFLSHVRQKTQRIFIFFKSFIDPFSFYSLT